MHPLQQMIAARENGSPLGICSVCSANEFVLAAGMDRAKKWGVPLLVEATANQVNQFGGYTGMHPEDFVRFVRALAEKEGFPQERLILGGDHLGPLTWKDEPAESAMEKARELVRQYVLAGYQKIHLDTSMRLGDDDPDAPLCETLCAERGAALAAACERAYDELLQRDKNAPCPVYVIGSEVPVPGGVKGEDEGLRVTSPEAFERTLRLFCEEFGKAGAARAAKQIIAVVVQPGVEFGSQDIHAYRPAEARELCARLAAHPGVVFEGHSTDYQTPESLQEMVRDGIAILKVGPALTFALREGLFALSQIERELMDTGRADFPAALEQAMLECPKNWQGYYGGTPSEQAFLRKYSLSDRCRSEGGGETRAAATGTLRRDLRGREIPRPLLSQYLPRQYAAVRAGTLPNEPRALLIDAVGRVLDEYYGACGTWPRCTYV